MTTKVCWKHEIAIGPEKGQMTFREGIITGYAGTRNHIVAIIKTNCPYTDKLILQPIELNELEIIG